MGDCKMNMNTLLAELVNDKEKLDAFLKEIDFLLPKKELPTFKDIFGKLDES